MFRVFLAFCIFFSIDYRHLKFKHCVAFLKFLVFNKVSEACISNHISAVMTKLQLYGLPVTKDSRIKYFSKALALQAPLKISLKAIIDIPTLAAIALRCYSMYMGQVYKAAFLLSFFSFLRISNLVPHAINSFNPLEQLARGDIFFANPKRPVPHKVDKNLATQKHH